MSYIHVRWVPRKTLPYIEEDVKSKTQPAKIFVKIQVYDLEVVANSAAGSVS
jgi:hypothetical protein